MALSSDLISQFVQVTKEEKPNKETTVYGTIVAYDGGKYVRLDGSELLTPISMTADALDGERVTVMIKNHTALVTGNISSPSARSDTVKELDDTVQDIGSKISEFEIIIADKVSVERLEAEIARIDALVAENVTIRGRLEANEADINNLTADNVTVNEKLTAAEADIDKLETNKLDAEVADIRYASIGDLEATDAKIVNLEATYGDFQVVTASRLNAAEANIYNLDTVKLNAKDADLKYANIDFSNIGEAAITKIFSESGIIEDLIVSEGKITGELVGVTIKGDLIEANTLKADKLVVKGSDGIYYKLNIEAGATTSEEVTEEELQNGLHGTAIIAKTITAEKIAVDDLVAFDATIGGFNITENAIYSGVKTSADNTTTGIYMDKEGQLVVGDSSNFLKYYKDQNGNYKLEISASSITMSTTGKTVEEELEEVEASVKATVKEIIIEYAVSDSPNTPPGGGSSVRKLGTPEIYITEVSSGSTIAVLGQAILGQMILGTPAEDTAEVSATSYTLRSVTLDNSVYSSEIVWSTTPPTWIDGQYIWQRITYIYTDGSTVVGEPTCITGATGAVGPQGEKGDDGLQGAQGPQGEKGDKGDTGAAGKDAITYRIESSLGSVFLDGQNDITILTAKIYRGSTEIDISGAYGYTWYLVEKNGTERVIGNGKTLSISSTDIAGKGVYFVADDGDIEEIIKLDTPVIRIVDTNNKLGTPVIRILDVNGKLNTPIIELKEE